MIPIILNLLIELLGAYAMFRIGVIHQQIKEKNERTKFFIEFMDRLNRHIEEEGK